MTSPASPQPGNQGERHSLRFRDTGNGVLYACSCDDWEEVANDDADAARVYRLHGEHIAAAASVCECGCDETDHGINSGCIHCRPCRTYAPRRAAAAAGETGAEAIASAELDQPGVGAYTAKRPVGLTGAGEEADGPTEHDEVVFDDQCPITFRRCDRPCGTACILGTTEPAPSAASCEELHRTLVDGVPLVPADHWGNGCPLTEPAPSAGQDTGQMRDELADEVELHGTTMSRTWSDNDDEPVTVELGCRCGHSRGVVTAEQMAADMPGYFRLWREHVADALLDGPLRKLIAERDDLRRELDQARRQVQRCYSCEHEIGFHQPDGCWYAVESGRLDRDIGCPCGVSRDYLDRRALGPA